MKKRDKIIDELCGGYNALALATFDLDEMKGYGEAYLDGYADAMNQAGFMADGKPQKLSHLFCCHKIKAVRKAARKRMKESRKREV